MTSGDLRSVSYRVCAFGGVERPGESSCKNPTSNFIDTASGTLYVDRATKKHRTKSVRPNAIPAALVAMPTRIPVYFNPMMYALQPRDVMRKKMPAA